MKIPLSGSNLTAKIVSVVVALLLWLIVTLGTTFTYKVSLPITYVGPSEGYIQTGERPDRVLVLIKGSGRALLLFSIREMMTPERHYALVSLTELTTKGKHQITLDKRDIHLSDDSNLGVESILDNAFFSLYIDRLVTRNLRVNVDSLPPYSIEKGFVVVGRPLASPGLIVARGPEDVLNSLRSIRIESFVQDKLSGEKPVLNAQLRNRPEDLVTLNHDAVELKFTVEPLIRKVFDDVPLKLYSFPRKKTPQFTPAAFSVSAEGPESIITKLKPKDILISIQYRAYLDMSSRGEHTIRPEIRSPEGVSVTLSPEFIRFSDSAAKS